MFRNTCSKKLLFLALLTALGLIGFPGTGHTASPSQDDLKSTIKTTLEIFDKDFLSSMSLKLKVITPTAMKRMHGRSSSLVTYYGGKRGQYMQMENVSRDPVKYDSNAGISYDTNKNHLLALDKRVSIALEGNSWRVRHDRESLSIDPTNKVLGSKTIAPMLEVYPVGNHDAANLYYRYLLALGRGYSQLLDEIVGVNQNADGTYMVKANGKLFSPYVGLWTLEIDPAADFQVRKASFIQAGQAVPTFESQSSGQAAGGKIALPAQGTVRISHYSIDVQVVSYGSIPDEELATKTHERVAYDAAPTAADAMVQASYQVLFPKGTLLMDFGSIDSDGMPKVQRHMR